MSLTRIAAGIVAAGASLLAWPIPQLKAATPDAAWIGVKVAGQGAFNVTPLDATSGSFGPVSGSFLSAGISRDGRRLAYGRVGELRVSNLNGTDDQVIHRGVSAGTLFEKIRWSPAGDRIACITNRTLMILSASGEVQQVIRDGAIAGGSDISDYDWSPDGRRVVYCTVQSLRVPIAKKRASDLAFVLGALGSIKVRNLDTGATRLVYESTTTAPWLDDHYVLLTSESLGAANFRWSPAGDELVISHSLRWQVTRASTTGRPPPAPTERNGQQLSLAVFDLGSRAVRFLITTRVPGVMFAHPVWSPDGAEIAYVDNDGIYAIRSTTSGSGLIPLGASVPGARLLAGSLGYPAPGAPELLDWIDPNPVRFTITTPKSAYEPGEAFVARVTASLTRPEAHSVAFRDPLVQSDDPAVLETSLRSPPGTVELTPAQPSVSFSTPVTAVDYGVAELSATATAISPAGERRALAAARKVSVSPLEIEIQVTPPALVLNNTPDGRKSPACILLENGVEKSATNCLEIVARVRNRSISEIRTVGITFAEDVLKLIQSRSPTNQGVPLRLVQFTPPAGFEPNGEAKRVTLGPDASVVYRWNLDAFDAPAALSIKVRATGELDGAEVVAFAEKEFQVAEKVLLEWGIRPLDGRTSYLSGQTVRVEGFLWNKSRESGEGRDLLALVYQLPEGNLGGGYMVPSDRIGAETAAQYFMFQIPPEGDFSRVSIGSVFRSFHTYTATRGKVRYGIRLWVQESDGSLTLATDQAVLAQDWLDEFQVTFAADPPPPDGFREECIDRDGYPPMFCGFLHGVYFEGTDAILGLLRFAGDAGLALKNLGGLILSESVFLVDRGWDAVVGDPAALDALLQEAYVNYLALVNLGVMAGEAGSKVPMAFEAFSIAAMGALDRFFRAVDEGDLEEVQFQMGKFFGANPDLALEALVVAGRFAAISRSLKQLADGATDNVVAAAVRQDAQRQAASLEQRLASAAADPNVTDLATALRAGDQLSDSLLARIYGVSSEQRRRLQSFAKRYDVIVTFRSRHPKSLELLRQKLAWPKPQALKWKGVSEIDIEFLGYRPEALARLELMEPPAGLLGKKSTEELSAALDAYMEGLVARKPRLAGNDVLQAEVRDRLKTQVEYWEKLSPAHELKDVESRTPVDIDFDAGAQFTEKVGRSAGVTDSRTLIHTPVEAGVDAVTGEVRRRWELRMSGGSGEAPRFVTGDVDFLAILDRHGGLIADDNMRIKLYHELAVLMDIQHGESFTFFLQHARVEHLRCCVEGTGEAMVTIGPWGRSTPTAGYFVDNLSIFEDGPNTRFLGPRKPVLDPEGKPKFDKAGKPIVIRRKDPTGEFMLIHGMPSAASVKYGLISHFIPLTFSESIGGFLKRLPFYFPSYLARLFSEQGPGDGAPQRQQGGGAGRGLANDPAPVPLVFHQAGPIIQAGSATNKGRLRVWTLQQGWQSISPAEAIALGQPGVADIAPVTSVAGGADAGTRRFDITPQAELGTPGRFLQPGDQIVLNPGGANQEFAILLTLDPFTISSPLAFHHDRGEVIAFVRSDIEDADGDGLPDDDETARGTLPNDPDSDGDGFLDGYEMLLGTDPLNAESLLAVLSVSHDPEAGTVTVIWSSVPGRSYTVEARDGLDPVSLWSPIGSTVAQEAASALALPAETEAGSQVRLYRIRLGD